MTDPDQLPALPASFIASVHALMEAAYRELGTEDPFYAVLNEARAAIVAERARADALQEKFNCADLMAQCMAGLREDCIEAGVVDESVPPMMYPEEIIPRLVRADALEAALSDVLEMAQEHADHFAAAFAGYKPERHAYYARALATARALLEKKT